MHEDTRGCRIEELRKHRSTRLEDLDVGVGASRIEVMSLESLIEVPAGLDMAETGNYIAYGPYQFRLIDGPLRVVDYCIQEPEKIDSRTGARLVTDRHHRWHT
jgi:hypothetical protein